MTDLSAVGQPPRVGVLVDLTWHPQAGGHVKCWERFAAAAAAMPRDIDLTVHFSGPAEGRHELAANVRYRIHPPVFSTARLPWLARAPDHTDLARYHPGLAPHLAAYDVIHTTDAFFAFAGTALRESARLGIPLVNSIHTDTPNYSQVFAADIIARATGGGFLARLLNDRLRLPERCRDFMLRKLSRHQARCAAVLVSRDDERERALAVLPPDRVTFLRRGVDRALFEPGKRDRAWLTARFGVRADRVVVLFVGRIDRGKNVMTLAEAVRRLAEAGAPVHLLCAGDGEDRPAIEAMLGERVTCPGVVDPETLARFYASADLFAGCSQIEVFANVVLEALASGLPALVAERGGMAWAVGDGGMVVRGPGPDPWAAAIGALAADAPRRREMARKARLWAERQVAGWDEVLAADLLPVWRRAAAERRQ